MRPVFSCCRFFHFCLCWRSESLRSARRWRRSAAAASSCGCARAVADGSAAGSWHRLFWEFFLFVVTSLFYGPTAASLPNMASCTCSYTPASWSGGALRTACNVAYIRCRDSRPGWPSRTRSTRARSAVGTRLCGGRSCRTACRPRGAVCRGCTSLGRHRI